MRKERLKDIGQFYSGLSGKSKEDFIKGNALFVTYSNIFNNPALNMDISDTVSVEEGERQNKIQFGDILFTGSSETPEEAGMSSVVLSKPTSEMYLNSFCFGFRLYNPCEVLPSYMRYMMRSLAIRKEITKTAFGVTRFNINKEKFANIQIPLPPLSIQQRIVSVLDSFTTLIHKMKQEVEKRKKQMEYYKDKLMTFENTGIKNEKLINCANILYGYPFDSSLFSEENQYIPLIRIRDIVPGKASTYYRGEVLDSYIIKKDNILVGMDGNFNLSRWNDRDGLLNQRALKISAIPDVTNESYLYHLLGPIFKRIELNTSGGSVKHLSAKAINQIEIPLPSLQLQQEIGLLLDKFESYISKLERMIELRQKQYEYYREQLLIFD